MRNIKARYIWISVAVSFLIAVGLIIGVTYTKGAMTTFVIVVLAMVFIYMTIAIQIASTKTFRYKAKPKNYPKKAYDFIKDGIDERIKSKGYKPRTTPYGMSYLKVSGTNAYKIVLIRNFEKYFNPEDTNQAQSSSEKSLDKCKKFIGFEIFLDYDDDTLKKLPDFNLQGTNVHYSGLYVKDNQLLCPNYLEPNADFKELYDTMKQDLNLKDMEENLTTL